VDCGRGLRPAHTRGMTRNHQPREAKGRPTGGQWAPIAKDAAGVALTQEEFDDHLEDLSESLDRGGHIHHADTFGTTWDREDLRQDALVEMLRRARSDGHIANINKGYARGYQRGLVMRAVQARREGRDPSEHLKVNSSNMAGFRAFSQKVDELEAEYGRPLKAWERDAIAEQVRDEWPSQRHKPTRGFHRNMNTDTLDTDTDHFNRAQAPSAEESFFAEEADLGMLSDEVEYLYSLPRQGGARKKAGWNAICKVNDIPVAPLGALNNRQIAECRKHIDGTKSSIIKTLEAWEEGESSDRTEALFKPFGAVTKDHRNQIADLFHEQPDNTPLYWEMAVAGATKRNFKADELTTTP